jgi:hypothetical protein
MLCILRNSRYAGYILGFHIIGDGLSHGYSTPLCREELLEIVTGERAKLSEEDLEIMIPDLQLREGEVKVQSADWHGEVDAVYITRNCQLPASVYTNTYIAPYEGDGPPIVEPRLAVARTRPQLFELNRAKFGPVEVETTQEQLDPIRAEIVRRFKECAPGVIMRNYSFSEAIQGIDNLSLDPVVKTTSPGYPDAELGFARKDYFFNDERARLQLGPEFPHLARECQNLIDILSDGKVPISVHKDVPKGEKLKKKKVENGMYRLINSPPLSALLVTTMFFGSAIEMIKKGRVVNGCMGPINPYSKTEWSFLANFFKSKGGGQHCGSGDYMAYDHHQASIFIRHAFMVMIDLYPRQDTAGRRIRVGLMEMITDSYHIYGSVVEQYFFGNPSGNRLTTEINCIVNVTLFMLSWADLHQDDIRCLPEFWSHVALVVLGDDNLFSVDDEYAPSFTEAHVAKVVAKHGHTYTDPEKNPARATLSPLENHAIIKRKFRYEPILSGYVAPLELGVVLEGPMWTKGGTEYENIAYTNMQTAIRELSLHGKEVFEEWMPKFEAFAGRMWRPIVADFNTVLHIVADV